MKLLAQGLALCLVLVGLVASAPLSAAEVVRTYDFTVDEWLEIQETDGAVTLHRIRIDRKEGRLTKSTLARPHNQEFLETVGIQLEYTNESSQKWRTRIMVRWLDEDGRVIDGFSANEEMEKKSARKIAQASVSTLKYGLERARTLEVEIRFEP